MTEGVIVDKHLADQYKVQLGKTDAGKYHVPRMDESTRSLITIDQNHHNLLAGNYFRSGMNFTLANGNVAGFGMTMPTGPKEVHITWVLNASADGTFAVLEDVTSFAGGAAVIPLNQNRISTETSDAVCISGMTGADPITPTGGTIILSAVLSTGKGSTVNRSAGEGFVFKTGTSYFFRYTNGANANIIQLACEWHCHTPEAA